MQKRSAVTRLSAIGLVALMTTAGASWIGTGAASAASETPPALVSQSIRPGSDAMLNPQPLPPKTASFQDDLSSVMLNPQPLPPKWQLEDEVTSVLLNPRPLPPKTKNRSIIVGGRN